MNFLRKFLGQKKSTIDSVASQPRGMSIDPRLEPLGVAVFAAALEAGKLIGEGWADRTGQSEMPTRSSWAIRAQELGFFLHIVNRLAFMVGGNEVRAALQDYLTSREVNNLVDVSWNSSNVKPGFNEGQWSANMKLEVLDVVNDAEMEYAVCATMFKLPFDIKAGDLTAPSEFLAPDDTDITGRLAKRIAEDTGQADTPKLRELVWGSNVTSCNSFQIVRQVEAAIQSIRLDHATYCGAG